MTTNAKNIAWDIINCGLQNAPNSNSECNALYISQQCASIADFQIPEPWNGDIENAPILFVGLNPGFLDVELYPKLGNPYWLQANGGFDEAKVEDFFEHRFNSRHQYVQYPNKTKIISGGYKVLRHTFWGYVKSIADKIMNGQSTPGVDFAITEIVHCKSRDIRCIDSKCYDKCFKHFNNIMSIAQNLQFMVVVGSATKNRMSKYFGISPVETYKWYYNVKFKDKTINIIFVDHNAAWGASAKNIPQHQQSGSKAQCTAEANFTPEELVEIKKHGEDIIAKYRNNPTGSLAEFVKKCESSAKLDEHGISNGKI